MRLLDSKDPALAPLIAAAPDLLEHLDAGSRAHLDGLCQLLTDAGVAYTLNPRLVRGLDYYNRTVFEWLTDRLGSQDAVCSGGRYDGLVEQLGGQATPAVGWAMGIERLVALVEDAARVPAGSATDVYAVLVGDAATRAGLLLAERLRDALPGLRLTLNCGGGSLKSQLKRADKSGARYALVLGDDELAREQVALKDLRGEGGQGLLDFPALVARLGAAFTDR